MGEFRAQSLARMLTNGVPDRDFPASAGNPGIIDCITTQADGRVIIGGSFDGVMSQDFPNLARFMTDGTLDTNWTPCPDGSVKAVFPYGSDVYAAGSFNEIGGADVSRVARLDGTDGQTIAGWTNKIYGVFYAAAIDDAYFYFGGIITNVNGVNCTYLARTRHSDNQLDSAWLPSIDNTVMSLAADGSHVYCGGAFDVVSGQPLTNLARISRTTGVADSAWKPDPNASIQTLVVDGTWLYAAGSFSVMAGESLYSVARVSKTTPVSADTGWIPNTGGGSVQAIVPYGDCVYLGGSFTYADTEIIANVARVGLADATVDAAWHPDPDSDVRAVLPLGDRVIVGGLFGNIGGMSRAGYAWLEPFRVEAVRLGDGIPQVIWRSGSNMLYTVQYAYSPSGTYMNAKENVLGTPETNVFTDADRPSDSGVYYRVLEL